MLYCDINGRRTTEDLRLFRQWDGFSPTPSESRSFHTVELCSPDDDLGVYASYEISTDRPIWTKPERVKAVRIERVPRPARERKVKMAKEPRPPSWSQFIYGQISGKPKIEILYEGEWVGLHEHLHDGKSVGWSMVSGFKTWAGVWGRHLDRIRRRPIWRMPNGEMVLISMGSDRWTMEPA